MRLLDFKSCSDFSLTKELGGNVPPYSILSHTWGEDDDEPTIQDLKQGSGKHKVGYNNSYFVDSKLLETACSMSGWTHAASIKRVVLSWPRQSIPCSADVSAPDGEDTVSSGFSWQEAFQKSRWFTRGWTLQELIAPASIDLFSEYGKWLGDKRSLEQQIHDVTRISIKALRGHPLSYFSVSERVAWAEDRETKRKEDESYSLMGIFDIHMTLIYGEGREKAFGRLRNKINKHAVDLETRDLETQEQVVTQASRKRKQYTTDDLDLEDRLAELERHAAETAKEHEILKSQLQNARSENKLLRSMSMNSYPKSPELLLNPSPIRYSPRDFYTEVLQAQENKTPSHRIIVKDGERLMAPGAVWDYIMKHPLYMRGLVDVGDVSERLKMVAKCDGEGPVFGERELIEAIEQSAAGNDRL